MSTNDASLATPTGMAVSSNGATLYVAAFGSDKVGVFSTSQLEADTFTPSPASHWPVSGGGPSGLVLDEPRGRLYVLTRFDNAISIVDTSSGVESAHVPLYNPEPASVVDGRPFLYDARFTSSNGEAACASCHIFGDFDSLAWDLGNPDDDVLDNTNPFRVPDPFGQSLPRPPPDEGAHDDAEPARHGEPRPDALARRSVGRQRCGRQRARRGRGIQALQRRVRGPARPQRAAHGGRDAGVHDVHPAGDVSAEPDPRARQLAHGRIRPPAGTSSSRPADSDVFQNCDGCHRLDPANGFFGSRRLLELRVRDAEPEDPAPAEPLPEGRHVRHAGDPLRQQRRQRQQGRAGPRLRLPARRQHRHRVPLPSGDRLQPRQPRRVPRPEPRRLPARRRRRHRSAARSSSSCSRSTRTWRRSSASR